MKRTHGVAFVLADPAFVYFVNRNGIQIVQLFASPPNGNDQIRLLKQSKVLGDGLARHVQVHAKLSQRLPVVCVEPVEQFPAGGIGQRFEHLVHEWIICNHLVAFKYSFSFGIHWSCSLRKSKLKCYFCDARWLPVPFAEETQSECEGGRTRSEILRRTSPLTSLWCRAIR